MFGYQTWSTLFGDQIIFNSHLDTLFGADWLYFVVFDKFERHQQCCHQASAASKIHWLDFWVGIAPRGGTL